MSVLQKKLKLSLMAYSTLFISFTSLAQSGYYAELEDRIITTSNVSEINGTTEFVMEMDVYIDSFTTWTNLLGQKDSNTNRVALVMHEGNLYGMVADGQNTWVKTTGSALTEGQWQHVAMTYNGATGVIRIFVDGVRQTETLCNSCTVPATTPFTTADFKLVANKFKGKVDNVRVWSTNLTGATIRDWKDKAVNSTHPNYSDLVLNWEFQDHTSLIQALPNNGTFYTGDVYTTGGVTADLEYDRQYLSGYITTKGVGEISARANININNPAPYSTHLIYTHLASDNDGTVGRYKAGVFTLMTSGSALETTVTTEATTVKSWRDGTNPEAKLVLTWGSNKGSPSMEHIAQEAIDWEASHSGEYQKLKDLMKSIRHQLETLNMDAIDVNWEQEPEAAPYDRFFRALHDEMKNPKDSLGNPDQTAKKYDIIITVNSNHNSHHSPLKPTLKQYADTVQLMFYGNGKVDKSAETMAPLSHIQTELAEWTTETTTGSNDGLDKEKIVIGLPAFGLTGNKPLSAYIYRDILADNPSIASNLDKIDDTSGVTHYFNGEDTIREKTLWAKKNGYKGVMFWEFRRDADPSNVKSLLNVASEALGVNP